MRSTNKIVLLIHLNFLFNTYNDDIDGNEYQ